MFGDKEERMYTSVRLVLARVLNHPSRVSLWRKYAHALCAELGNTLRTELGCRISHPLGAITCKEKNQYESPPDGRGPMGLGVSAT